jgi:hypothetical protein
VKAYENLLSSSPQDDQARIHLAAAQFPAGEPKNALDTLHPVLREAQPAPQALDIASNASEKLGDTPHAVEFLRGAIVQNPMPTSANTGTAACTNPPASNPITGLSANSGDYNADGDNFDYPNVGSYSQGSSRQAFLARIFSAGQFAQPGAGTEDSEKQNPFREPNFAETDAAFYKDNRFAERFDLQLRFEFFNIFNRTNLGFVDADPLDPNFGKVSSQQLPRWWQVAARFTF